jgi:hypothetical protein
MKGKHRPHPRSDHGQNHRKNLFCLGSIAMYGNPGKYGHGQNRHQEDDGCQPLAKPPIPKTGAGCIAGFFRHRKCLLIDIRNI